MIRWPWRRKPGGVLNPDAGAVLIPDTGRLAGGERLSLGDGLYINLADLAGFPDIIPVHHEEEQ